MRIRKEIKIARVDIGNKTLMDELARNYIWFTAQAQVYLVIEGHMHRYDGWFGDYLPLKMHL